ncbi:unnamed protein product [Linum tenue]|uniref:Uncharacterized protein n=1 Tax=Linum tenue TaxID=586396 RepID=A0AAV0IWZ9_9ROSI|nr:unnamed protein product [Linum tenue]
MTTKDDAAAGNRRNPSEKKEGSARKKKKRKFDEGKEVWVFFVFREGREYLGKKTKKKRVQQPMKKKLSDFLVLYFYVLER